METEAEKQLATLVSMPTMSDDIVANDMALDYIEQYFISCGLHCERNRFDGHGTLLASSRPDNAQNPTVLLAGHVDVMTGSDTLFKLRKKGDKLLGRGVYDMKFATAGYMQLASELRGQLDAYDFAILITTDEEYGNRDNINGTRQLLERGLRPSVCILPDSTAPGWEVERMAKASWRFDLIAKGISAHGSRPWEGESASFKLLHALQEIKAHFEGHGPETNTLNIAVIHGGETYNLIPDHMTAALEIRVINDEAYTVLLKIILDICKRHDIVYKERAHGSPVHTDLHNPFVGAYMDSVEAVTGKRPKGQISFAGSDAPYFAAAGIPCILSCPEGGRHHSEDEWISRKSFLQFVPILRDYLEKGARLATKRKEVDTIAALV